MFKDILPTAKEAMMVLPGDELIKEPSAVIDSAFTLPVAPSVVFPWFVQLGKQRAGWYFPKTIERFIPRSKRGLRKIDNKWQQLTVGRRIPDYGGKNGYFDCFYLERNKVIGYKSTRGKVNMTWVLTFWPYKNGTRVVIRLRIEGPNVWFIGSLGKLFDRLTILGLYKGLEERLKSVHAN